MSDHASEIIPMLIWMIVTVGGILFMLAIYVWKRLQATVDALPSVIAARVKEVHDEILKKMDTLSGAQRDLDRDVRGQLSALDRRVTVVETICTLNHKQNGG